MLAIDGVQGFRDRVGQELGVSDWYLVTQDEIDAFAAATDDFERIHVDPRRARETPFGRTIAHGLLTLSLGPKFSYEMLQVDGVPLHLNYGFDRVRFVTPLPVGSRVRMRARLTDVSDVELGVLTTIEQTFEREGQEEPVCVAQSRFMYFSTDPVDSNQSRAK
jgi:acyl dehydratase